jgi:hypothetical protein
VSNFDHIQIKDNVKPGDIIITSDMNEYKNSKAIIINNAAKNDTKASANNIRPNDLLFARILPG